MSGIVWGGCGGGDRPVSSSGTGDVTGKGDDRDNGDSRSRDAWEEWALSPLPDTCSSILPTALGEASGADWAAITGTVGAHRLASLLVLLVLLLVLLPKVCLLTEGGTGSQPLRSGA